MDGQRVAHKGGDEQLRVEKHVCFCLHVCVCGGGGKKGTGGRKDKESGGRGVELLRCCVDAVLTSSSSLDSVKRSLSDASTIKTMAFTAGKYVFHTRRAEGEMCVVGCERERVRGSV